MPTLGLSNFVLRWYLPRPQTYYHFNGWLNLLAELVSVQQCLSVCAWLHQNYLLRYWFQFLKVLILRSCTKSGYCQLTVLPLVTGPNSLRLSHHHFGLVYPRLPKIRINQMLRSQLVDMALNEKFQFTILTVYKQFISDCPQIQELLVLTTVLYWI